MERTSYQASNCSIARTLQVLGEKWTLLIIRESFYGATRFEQFHSVLNCPRAIQVNIVIMRVFVRLRIEFDSSALPVPVVEAITTQSLK